MKALGEPRTGPQARFAAGVGAWPHGFGPVELPQWCVQVCNPRGHGGRGAGMGHPRDGTPMGTGHPQGRGPSELGVELPAGHKVLAPHPDDLVAVGLGGAVDGGQGRLLPQLGHPGSVAIAGRAGPAQGRGLQPLPQLALRPARRLAEVVVVAQDVGLLDVLLLLVLRQVELLLDPAVSVPSLRGLFLGAAAVDGLRVNGKPVSGQPPPPPPQRLARG